jgi:hypothetical protein
VGKRQERRKERRDDRPPRPDGAVPSLFPSLVVALAAFVLYLAQTPGVSGDKDGSEFVLVLSLGGVPHPTGYPLYSQVGHLFVRLLHALGASWPFAANCWSAVGGGFAVFFFHGLTARLVGRFASAGRGTALGASLVATAIFALNPIWTYETTLAEVYSWHVAWVLAAGWAFVVLHESWSRDSGGGNPRRVTLELLGWSLLCGLGGAHHATSVLVALPLTISLGIAGIRGGRLRPKHLAVALAGVLLPLSSYGFVAFRAFHPSGAIWPALAPSWSSVVAHLTGADYQGLLGSFHPSPEQREFLRRFVYPVLVPSLLVLLFGAFSRGTGRGELRGLAAAALLSAAYAWSYGVPDPSSYFLAPIALSLSAAAAWLVIRGSASDAGRRLLPYATGTAGIVALLVSTSWIATGNARKGLFVSFDERVHGMWQSIPFDDAFVVFGNDMSWKLVEYQRLRGEKPRLEIVNPGFLLRPALRARFVERLGFDPLQGAGAPPGAGASQAEIDAWCEKVAGIIDGKSPLPVVLFDPPKQSVRLLRKKSGGEPAASDLRRESRSRD